MSFAFSNDTKKGFRDSWSSRDGRDVRTIERFADISDYTLCDQPAYEGTSVQSLARAAHLVDVAETELRSGRGLSKATIGALVPAVGSLVAAGQHVDTAHKHSHGPTAEARCVAERCRYSCERWEREQPEPVEELEHGGQQSRLVRHNRTV